MFKKLFGKKVETTSLERAYNRAMKKIYEAKKNKENEVVIIHISKDIDELVKMLNKNYTVHFAYRFGFDMIIVAI